MDDDVVTLEELSHRLWDERRIVTYLLFKLTVTRLLLAADERRFLPDALREVDRTVELLREGEEQRETALRELAARWRVSPASLPLDELARLAPPPYDHTFADHHAAFRELAEEIEEVARTNRMLARSGLDDVTGTLELLTGTDRGATATTYDAQGQLGAAPAVGGHLREVL